ncbi:MAG: hypothetical protein WBD78_11145 [Methylocella sp.]
MAAKSGVIIGGGSTFPSGRQAPRVVRASKPGVFPRLPGIVYRPVQMAMRDNPNARAPDPGLASKRAGLAANVASRNRGAVEQGYGDD